MKKFLFLITLLILSAGFAQAQRIQTMKGYFCGMSEGDGGFPSIRVNGKPVTFSMYADEPEVKFIGRKDQSLYNIVGREVIIAYVVKKKYRRPEKIVRSITFTGKINKKTKPCDDE